MRQELTNKPVILLKNLYPFKNGSIQESIAKSNLSDANVVSLAQPGEAINELKSGQVEGVVLEKAIAQGYIEQNNEPSCVRHCSQVRFKRRLCCCNA